MGNEKIQIIAKGLNNVTTEEGLMLASEMVTGEVDMVKVEIQDREEFPVFITMDEDQILCITYLWKENEVNTDKRIELLEAMLTMNVPMPLSSFGKVGNQYLTFGAMGINSSIEEILNEVIVLSDNTLNAVEAFQDFLK